MVGIALFLSGFQLATDTVRLDVREALERGLEASPTLSAARSRAEAASGRTSQAAAWPNPQLEITAENVGQQSAFTGEPGLAGLEGQAIVRAPIPFAGQRSAPIQIARADERAALASLDAAAARVRSELLTAMGAFLRDQAIRESVAEELVTLSRIAEDLTLRAEAGRGSAGDAARADLARGLAATRLARQEAALGLSAADLARLLGYPPSTVLQLGAPACVSLPAAPAQGDLEGQPEVRVARARLEAARASVEAALAARVPSLEPQAGVRRTGGQTGLYVGVAASLPFVDRSSGKVAAARAEETAVMAEQRGVEERLVAARAGARRALEAFERAGTRFDATWFESLERTVTAATARFELGESTLVDLLDSRRARLQALEDYHTWQAEWWAARVELTRLEGALPGASLICSDPYREVPR